MKSDVERFYDIYRDELMKGGGKIPPWNQLAAANREFWSRVVNQYGPSEVTPEPPKAITPKPEEFSAAPPRVKMPKTKKRRGDF